MFCTGQRRGRAPHDVGAPGVTARIQCAARQALVAPDDLAAPRVRGRVGLTGPRGAEELRELHRPLRVEEAAALRQCVVVVDLGGVLQDCLDQVRRKRGVCLQHQRHRAADDRCGHAGARERQVRLVGGGDRAVEQRAGARWNRTGWSDRSARRPPSPVRRCRASPGSRSPTDPSSCTGAMTSSVRSTVPCVFVAPTVRTHGALPGAVMPPYCVSPDPLRPKLPAADTTTMPASTARFAASVSGSDRYDSVTAAPTDRLMTRMLYCRPVLHRPLQRRDHVADAALAVLVEHLEADEVGGRRDAGAGTVRVEAIAGDDAGDVRAVAVVVVRGGPVVDEVDEGRHALAVLVPHGARARDVGEVVVPAGHARVDDRDTDAGAVVAHRQLHGARADRDGDAVQMRDHRPVRWMLSTSGFSRARGAPRSAARSRSC